ITCVLLSLRDFPCYAGRKVKEVAAMTKRLWRNVLIGLLLGLFVVIVGYLALLIHAVAII
ncbi:MAG: hypothetical protein ACTIMD_05200, partial [Loigolactobacillus coryniformis]